MIYPASFEKKVGFDRIRELLAEKCLGPLDKERCEKICFSTKPEEIRLWIGQVYIFPFTGQVAKTSRAAGIGDLVVHVSVMG